MFTRWQSDIRRCFKAFARWQSETGGKRLTFMSTMFVSTLVRPGRNPQCTGLVFGATCLPPVFEDGFHVHFQLLVWWHFHLFNFGGMKPRSHRIDPVLPDVKSILGRSLRLVPQFHMTRLTSHRLGVLPYRLQHWTAQQYLLAAVAPMSHVSSFSTVAPIPVVLASMQSLAGRSDIRTDALGSGDTVWRRQDLPRWCCSDEDWRAPFFTYAETLLDRSETALGCHIRCLPTGIVLQVLPWRSDAQQALHSGWVGTGRQRTCFGALWSMFSWCCAGDNRRYCGAGQR